jgi:hypothetical protein
VGSKCAGDGVVIGDDHPINSLVPAGGEKIGRLGKAVFGVNCVAVGLDLEEFRHAEDSIKVSRGIELLKSSFLV